MLSLPRSLHLINSCVWLKAQLTSCLQEPALHDVSLQLACVSPRSFAVLWALVQTALNVSLPYFVSPQTSSYLSAVVFLKYQFSSLYFYMLDTYMLAWGSKNDIPLSFISDVLPFIHSFIHRIFIEYLRRGGHVIQPQSTSLTSSSPHSFHSNHSEVFPLPGLSTCSSGCLKCSSPRISQYSGFLSLLSSERTSLTSHLCICSLSHYPLFCVEHNIIIENQLV